MTSGKRQNDRALVCFAVKEEARFFKPSPKWRMPAAVAITGIGKQNAARVIQQLLETFSPAFVLTCGFAGGLNPDLPRGTIVFSDDDGLGISPALLQLGAQPACFHSSARVAVTAEEKRQLWTSTHADAVEMESAVIRKCCRERGIPSATLRVISDSADEDLPLDFNKVMTPDQTLSYLKLAAELLRSPAKIPKLLQLHRNTRVAASRLGECLHLLLERHLW